MSTQKAHDRKRLVTSAGGLFGRCKWEYESRIASERRLRDDRGTSEMCIMTKNGLNQRAYYLDSSDAESEDISL